MTACVNKHSKRVAAVISASLVGALSLGVAAPAFAAEGVQALTEALPSTEDWKGVTFDWSVEKDEYGWYTVQKDEDFTLESGTYADGTTPVSMADVTVLYVATTGVADIPGGSGKPFVYTETPSALGEYTAFVFNGKVELNEAWNDGTSLYAEDAAALNALPHQAIEFRVVAKSLDGAFAYQGDDVNDTKFQYTGFSFNDGGNNDSNDIHFADASGNELATSGADADVTIASIQKIVNGNATGEYKGAGALIDAGTYIATLKATSGSGYEGTEQVEFTIRQIDLENDTFTVDPAEVGSNAYINGFLNQSVAPVPSIGIYVNGEKLAGSLLDLSVTSGVDKDGRMVGTGYAGGVAATLKLKVVAYNASGSTNFVDSAVSGTADALVVDHLVSKYYYDGETVENGDTLRFETAKNEAFDPSAITAVYNDADVARDVTVYKDGEKVTDYSEPGTYTVQVSVKTDPRTLEYAGTCTFDVVVVSKRFSEQPKVFASVDGKDVKNPVEYDAKAVVPKVVAKAGSTVLTEGEDYTVAYKDSEGNAVEEIVEPGEYTCTVDFGTSYYWKNGVAHEVQNVEFTVTVTKAGVSTAKADQDLYAYVEDQAVAPTFTAYTKANFKGLSVAIDPAADGATYYEVVCGKDGKPVDFYFGDDATAIDTDGDGIGDTWVYDDPMTGSELTETGWYVAELVVPNDDAHFTGTVVTAPFEVSSYAVFSDVDADAWYAQDVYKAAQLGYMTGISGTDLFMPEAEISRAELAKVFANMAGGADEGFKNPSQFDDVDPVAWYAEPIAWASEAGIVTGYDDTTFGPMDKATREQVAVMLYRYAKNQGKDVTVADADAALAAYKDADQVSDWAKEAMAWAVESGVFGQGTDELWAKQNIKRDAVAAIAVRFQPEALPEA